MCSCLGRSLSVVSVLAVTLAVRADEKPAATGVPPGGATITLLGEIVPERTVRVSPRSGGTVREVLAEVGTRVEAGQVLARLDRAECEAQFQRDAAALDHARAAAGEVQAQIIQHEAAVAAAEAAVKEAGLQRDYLRRKADRLRELAKNKSVTDTLADEADAQAQAAGVRVSREEAGLAALRAQPWKERLAVARADLAAAEATRALAKLRLDGTEIRAPIGGTILSRRVTVGETVAVLTDGRPVTLFEVADLAHLEASVEIPGQLYNRVLVGNTCEVQIDALPGRTYKGRVVRVAPVLSPATRCAPARVQVDVPDGDTSVRSGMIGSVRILTK